MADIDFVTLGMLIIDEIHIPGKESMYDIPGGAGFYSALGARIFSPPPVSRSVGWIVDAGSDFPASLREIIESWQSSCVVRETRDRLTTRGWNQFGENEERAFRYTTPKLRIDHTALTAPLLRSKSFHLICSPTRCLDLIQNITQERDASDHKPGGTAPWWIWEPVPDLCTPAEIQNCYEALKCVDVISPNHSELCSFFGVDAYDGSNNLAKDVIERCSHKMLTSGIGKTSEGAVVVRAGKDGCYVATKTRSRWIPPYHVSSSRVVDPTGGGNTFLGGFAVGLVRSRESDTFGKLVEAALWGSVAASFAIEQVGPPALTSTDGQETWNGQSVKSRLAEMARGL